MKTYLFLSLAVFLTACASKPKPRIVEMPHSAPGTILPSQGIESIRYSENLKAYPVGRYVDPNSRLVMHERHTVYRVETTAKWNLHPTGPVAVPLGPALGVIDPARQAAPVNAEVLAEVAKQKAATQALLDQGTKFDQTLSQLTGAIQATKQLGQQNLQLRQQVTTAQKRLDALEEELRKQQAEAVLGSTLNETNKW